MEDIVLWFGKYKGKALRDVPVGYLRWMTAPDTQRYSNYSFSIPQNVRSEAKNLLEIHEYSTNRLAGMEGCKTDYIAVRYPSLANLMFDNQENAFEYSRVVFEVLPSAHKKRCTPPYTHYKIVLFGDIAHKISPYYRSCEIEENFLSLSDALSYLIDNVLERCESDGNVYYYADPEDDRILIVEVLQSGHEKVVWHFSGWHYDTREFYGLEQGKLPGHNISLYDEVDKDLY